MPLEKTDLSSDQQDRIALWFKGEPLSYRAETQPSTRNPHEHEGNTYEPMSFKKSATLE
jgi:hypothetical protein